MTNLTMTTATPRDRSWLGRALYLCSALLVTSGCDDLLQVSNPGSLLDDDLKVPQLEGTLSSSAEGAANNSYTRSVRYANLLGNHYWHPNVQDFGLNMDAGWRDRDNVVADDIYDQLASARWIADNMIERLSAMVAKPESHKGVADSYFWGGVARLQLAGSYRAVTYDAGAPITPRQAVQDARDRFLKAAEIAAAAGDKNRQAAAIAAAARAHRSLYFEGLRFHGEASSIREVRTKVVHGYDPLRLDGPLSGQRLQHWQEAERLARQALALNNNFVWNLRHGSPGPSNHLASRDRERMTPWYYDQLDPVSGKRDPRITYETPSGNYSHGWFGPTNPLGLANPQKMAWHTKYTPPGTGPFPVSRAAEAELIIAEARYMQGDLNGTVEFINKVRARSGLPAYSGVGKTAAEIWAQFFYERDTELWLEGRNWEDCMYYDIVPYLWAEQNKQVGAAHRWPVSAKERANNPAFATGS